MARNRKARLKQKAIQDRLRHAPRSCGSCDECCTSLYHPYGASGVECPHRADGGGCGIYKDRPDWCRSFTCMWLDAGKSSGARVMFPDDARPDRLGVIFYPHPNSPDSKGRIVIVANELYPNAADRPKARALIDTLVNRGCRVVVGMPEHGSTDQTKPRLDLTQLTVNGQ